MGDKSVFPLFYLGTKSIIILQRNCKLIKRIKDLLSLNTGIMLFLYIHEKNKRILTTRRVKTTVSCDIHLQDKVVSYFCFIWFSVEIKLLNEGKFQWWRNIGSVDLKHGKREDFFGFCVSFSFVNYCVLKETNWRSKHLFFAVFGSSFNEEFWFIIRFF